MKTEEEKVSGLKQVYIIMSQALPLFGVWEGSGSFS